MTRTLLVLALATLACVLADTELNGDSSMKDSIEMTELNLRGVDGQSAFLNLGSGPSSYSLGVNPDGFFSISHQGKDIMSASASGIETPNLLAGTVSAFDLVLSGVPQWRMVNTEIFRVRRSKKNAKNAGKFSFVDVSPNIISGWTTAESISCQGITMLTQQKTQPIAKIYTGLPDHSHVRIVATAHFVDDWQGETAILKVNDQIVWTDSYDQRNGNSKFSMCGSDTYPEGRFTVPIDITLPFTGSELKLVFSSTVDEGSDARFGVSSVALYIRSRQPGRARKSSTSNSRGRKVTPMKARKSKKL